MSIINVKGCWNECPFFNSGIDGMECGHPHFNDKDPYDRLIITHDNSRDGKIPELCPLKMEDLTISTTYKLKT